MTGSITTGVIRYMAFIRPSPAPGLNLTSKGSTEKNRRTIKMKLSMRAIGLLGLFWKKRAHFLCEIDEENPVFARFCFKQRSLISTLGMFRVAPGHVSCLKRPCFAPRLGMFRNVESCFRNAERSIVAINLWLISNYKNSPRISYLRPTFFSFKRNV